MDKSEQMFDKLVVSYQSKSKRCSLLLFTFTLYKFDCISCIVILIEIDVGIDTCRTFDQDKHFMKVLRNFGNLLIMVRFPHPHATLACTLPHRASFGHRRNRTKGLLVAWTRPCRCTSRRWLSSANSQTRRAGPRPSACALELCVLLPVHSTTAGHNSMASTQHNTTQHMHVCLFAGVS